MIDLSTLINAAVVAQQEGRYHDAEQSLREVLRQSPHHAEALNDLGRLLLASGREDEAVAHFERAIAAQPDLGQAHFNRATALYRRGDAEAAAVGFAEAARLLPHVAKVHYQFAIALRDLGRLGEAIAAMRNAVELQPTSVEARARLADLLTEAGHFHEAVAAHEQVLELDPNHLATWLTLGCLHEALSEQQGAAICFRKALLLNPELDALRLKLAQQAAAAGELDQALDYLDAALERRPDWAEARYQRALVLLRKGRLAEAWPGFEARKACRFGAWAVHHLPEARDADLRDKSVLVYGEQGPAAELMLASCLPDIVTEARHVVVRCDARLQSLFARSFPRATVIAATAESVNDATALPCPVDGQLAIGSLPGRYRTGYRHFPSRASYLTCDPTLAARWPSKLDGLGDGTKIGVVRHMSDDQESSEPWLDLLQTPDCDWIDLWPQAGPISSAPCDRDLLHTFLSPAASIDEVAALMASLDLVVTTDHFTAHLAAGLGVPTWVLLAEDADWRWSLDQRRSPWHPTMRLFRREAGQTWSHVMAQVQRELVRQLASRRPGEYRMIGQRRAA